LLLQLSFAARESWQKQRDENGDRTEDKNDFDQSKALLPGGRGDLFIGEEEVSFGNEEMDAAIVIAEVKKSVQVSRACLLHAAVE